MTIIKIFILTIFLTLVYLSCINAPPGALQQYSLNNKVQQDSTPKKITVFCIGCTDSSDDLLQQKLQQKKLKETDIPSNEYYTSPFYELDNMILYGHFDVNVNYSNINTSNMIKYLKNDPRVLHLYKSKKDDSIIYTTYQCSSEEECIVDEGSDDQFDLAHDNVKMLLGFTNKTPSGLDKSGISLTVDTSDPLICKTALTKRFNLHNYTITINSKPVDLDKVNNKLKDSLCDNGSDNYHIVANYY